MTERPGVPRQQVFTGRYAQIPGWKPAFAGPNPPARVRVWAPEANDGPFSFADADTGEELLIVELDLVFTRDGCRGTFLYETGWLDYGRPGMDEEELATDTFVADVLIGPAP